MTQDTLDLIDDEAAFAPRPRPVSALVAAAKDLPGLVAVGALVVMAVFS